MGIRDSRHTVQLPRWAVNGETIDSDVIEPPGSQKDSGWVPQVDRPVAEWMNWLGAMAYLFLAYLESVLERRYNQNHVMRSAKGTTECQVSAGAGLSVNVVLGHVWIQGDMYEVPAAANLALAAADATHPRYDMIVARVTAGVPAYAVVTGTPAASPAEPAIAANEEAVARVRVNALAVVPTSIVDRRVYGRMGVAELKADEIANLGDVGGAGDHMIEVDTASGGVVRIAKVGTAFIGDGLLTVQPGPGLVIVDAEAVQFVAPIKRKYDLNINSWTWFDGSLASGGGPPPARGFIDSGYAIVANEALAQISAPVHVPNGAEITRIAVYGNRSTNATGLQLTLYSYDKGTGVRTNVANVSNSGSGPTGNFTLSYVLPSPHVVDQSKTYEINVVWLDNGADVGVRNAEVEYEETKPFDGL